MESKAKQFFRKGVDRLWTSATFTTWANLFVRTGSLAFVLPLVLIHFSTEEIAVFYLLVTIGGLQLIFMFGFGPTFSRFFAYAKGGAEREELLAMKNGGQPPEGKNGEPNWDVINDLVRTSSTLHLLLALLALVGLGLGSAFVVAKPIEALSNPIDGWISWAVLIVSLAINVRLTYYQSYLIGLGHLAMTSRWGMFCSLGALVLSLLVLITGGGLLALIVVRQSGIVAMGLVNRWLVHRLSRANLKDGKVTREDLPLIRMVWASAWRSGFGHVFGYGVTNGLAAVYAYLATTQQLAAFLLALRIFTNLNAFSRVPFYSKLPVIQSAYASADWARVMRLTKNGMRLTLWCYGVPFVGLVLFGSLAINLLEANAQLPSQSVLLCLGLAFFFERVGAMHLNFYTISNHVVWHWATLGSGILTLGSVYPLYSAFGMLGLAMSLLLGQVLFYIPYSLMHSRKMLRESLSRFELGNSLPVLMFLAIAAAIGIYFDL